ncbi:MAG: RidA family protein [Gammaproteobacteria bacterium]
MSITKRISSGSKFEEKIGYSRAIVDGRYIYVSGTTGYNYQTMTISNDVVEQAEQCFKNIDIALRQADSNFSEVVRVRYIFTDRTDFETCWPVLSHYLGKAKPAATAIIAGLVDEKMKLEIEVTARHFLSDD